MLVLNMNSKRQRRPNVRLWEVGDLPAAFTCGVSQRIKQRRWKDDSVRNNELENNGNSGFPQQFPPEFGFLEFGISAELSADMQDNSENRNPNSLKLVPEISGQDEFHGCKAELCFGSITRKSRLMKRRRRSPDSLFLDPWGSKVHLVRNVVDFTLKSGFNESSGHETTWTNEEACGMETAEPNFSVQMLQSSNEHCDEAETAFPLSTGEGDKGETKEFTINSVGEWLEEIGFGKYAELFEMHEVDEETLPLLTLDDLKEMGIFAVGIRRKLFNAIKKAKGRQCQISA